MVNWRMLLELTCPHCGRRLIGCWSDFVFPGSPYVCERCHKTSVVAVSLRAPTSEEQQTLDADPTTAAIKAARMAAQVPPIRHGRGLSVVARRDDE